MKYNIQETGGGSSYRGERSKLKGPYHYCARCGSRVHISNLTWQRGLLVCKKFNCADKHPFIGEREAAIVHVIQNVADSKEAMPDPKLIEPLSGGMSIDDDIVF